MAPPGDGAAQAAIRTHEARTDPGQTPTEIECLQLAPQLTDSTFPLRKARAHGVRERKRQLRRVPAAHDHPAGYAGERGTHLERMQPASQGLHPRFGTCAEAGM